MGGRKPTPSPGPAGGFPAPGKKGSKPGQFRLDLWVPPPASRQTCKILPAFRGQAEKRVKTTFQTNNPQGPPLAGGNPRLTPNPPRLIVNVLRPTHKAFFFFFNHIPPPRRGSPTNQPAEYAGPESQRKPKKSPNTRAFPCIPLA